jgi:predicted metalloprotease with PDZ domain
MPALQIDGDGYGSYQCADYDELVDHPVLLADFIKSSFEVRGVPHHLVCIPRFEFDVARLVSDCRKICEKHMDLFQARAPFKEYFFLLKAEDEGYGGLEHRASSALLCKLSDLPRVGERKEPEGYRTLLGLISHEYFHAWNVKQLKPTTFINYDYNNENYTELLWFCEGFTSYYDDLALLRCKAIDLKSYLELLSRDVTRLFNVPGRLKQSLADSSFDAWIKFYKPNENSSNATVSYYLKGSAVALALDLTIRLHTNHQKSLDTVMQSLWQKFGAQFKGITPEDIVNEANLAAASDLSAFFASYVRSTTELPLADLLSRFGIETKWKEKVYLGCNLKREGDFFRIVSIDDESPAMRAGLSANDLLVAVNELRVNPNSFDPKFSRFHEGEELRFHVFRRGWLRDFSAKLAKSPHSLCVLSKKEQLSDEQSHALSAWLHL